MKVKVKLIDVEEGRPEVLMSREDAEELGLNVLDRVRVKAKEKEIIAIVTRTTNGVKEGTIGISAEVKKEGRLREGAFVDIFPAEKPKAIEYIKKKLDKAALSKEEYKGIVHDVVDNKLSDAEISAFVSSVYINGLSLDEAEYLSRAIAESGETLDFKGRRIFDKHSLGGVPGNKVSLLIVPIVAAAGLTIPKTSSRAITSASGTADTMEVLAPVTFGGEEIVSIVAKTNGIIAWGGGVNLATADDAFIRVEYPLSLDARYLALCSVMAKKIATGVDFLVLDLPAGEGTKLKGLEDARKIANDFISLGERLGIKVECVVTYGDKPVGRAIGPALEAREALAALEGKPTATSLLEKALGLGGVLLEAGGAVHFGHGKEKAEEILKSGKALEKMREIIGAQGGNSKITSEKIELGEFRETIISEGSGYVTHISNKNIVSIARAAGAPRDKGAGILLHITKGLKVAKGDVLFEIFAEKEHKLDAALRTARQSEAVYLEGMLLERIPRFKEI